MVKMPRPLNVSTFIICSLLASVFMPSIAHASCDEQQRGYEEFRGNCDKATAASLMTSWTVVFGLGFGAVAMNQCRIRDEKLQGLNACRLGEQKAAADAARAEQERAQQALEQAQREQARKEEEEKKATAAASRLAAAKEIESQFEKRANELKVESETELDAFSSKLDLTDASAAPAIAAKQAELDANLQLKLKALDEERLAAIAKLDNYRKDSL